MTKNKRFEVGVYYDNLLHNDSHYEFKRWFFKPFNSLQYKETYIILNDILKKIKYNKVIELGAGAGTWTKLLFLNNPNTNLLDFDISKEMINTHKRNFPTSNSIEYFNGDFLSSRIEKYENKFDLFYSLRCIEYIPDMNKVFLNVNKILKKDGFGIIITKKAPIFKKTKFHSINVGITEVMISLENNNFKILKVVPVFYQIPFPFFNKSRLLNSILNKLFKSSFTEINRFNYLFVESYLVLFKKKK